MGVKISDLTAASNVADANEFEINESGTSKKVTASQIKSYATNATSVTAAGALMDSEVANLAQVKAFDNSDYATAAQGSTADAAMPKAGGTFTGDVTLTTDERLYFDTAQNCYAKHSGVDFFFFNDTGHTYITSGEPDKNVAIYTDNGSGNQTEYFRADGSTGESILYHYGSEKLATKSTGVDVTGNITVSGTVDGKDVSTLTTAAEAADEATALAIALG